MVEFLSKTTYLSPVVVIRSGQKPGFRCVFEKFVKQKHQKSTLSRMGLAGSAQKDAFSLSCFLHLLMWFFFMFVDKIL